MVRMMDQGEWRPGGEKLPPNLPDDDGAHKFFRVAPSIAPSKATLPNTVYLGLVWNVNRRMFFCITYNRPRGVWEMDEFDEVELSHSDLRILLEDKGLI